MKKILALSLVVWLGAIGIPLLSAPQARAAEEFHVDDDYPDSEDADGDHDFRHIQAAIDTSGS